MVLGLVALALPARANEIYRWTDRTGSVHYTNTPTVGAQPTDMPERNAAEASDGERRDVAGEAPPANVEPSDEDRAYFASASLKRNALERELRATDKQLRTLDGRLADMARVRTRNRAGSDATGGVGAMAVDIRSEEERTLAAERDEVGKRAEELRAEGAKLREEVTARTGSTPSWWIDLR